MADTSTRTNQQTSSTSKHKRIVSIAVVGAIILLLLLTVSYFGVLSPSRFLPSSESRYAETSSLSLEVRHGGFADAETSLRRAVSEAGATIYGESVREYDGSKSAYFTIDVIDNAADGLINKLRTIGDVKSFSYSKGRTYQSNYGTAGLQPGYVRITISLIEKKSVFSSFSNLEANALGSTFSGSIVALFYFVVAVLPWALVILAIYFLIRYIRRKLSN